MGCFLKITFKCFALLALISLLGCKNSGSGEETPFSEIGDASVNCDSSDGGPSVCDTSQDGKQVMLAWTDEPCSAVSIANVAAYENTTLSCSPAGGCSANDSVKWRSPETGEIIYDIGSAYSVGIAWLNLADNGIADDSGPQSGDVFCCRDDQPTYADMYSSHCDLIP